jgi:NAD(P)-dependent dehydrogenase (short-subunit alcohol dehydrogenase family)
MNTTDRVAIITGASQGIGAGLVQGYRERGYRVVATSRDLAPQAGDVVTVRGDLRDPGTADRIVAAAMDRFGRVDTLVNNAGVFLSRPFTEYTVADFEAVTGVNVTGFFHVTQRVVRRMLERGTGHIVNITASLADQPRASVPAALASLTKGGLTAVTRALAVELARKGIRVNAVAPGTVNTPMHPPETHAALAKMHPLGRLAEVKDIVDAVLYLESATFVTGEILHVDGGSSAGQD